MPTDVQALDRLLRKPADHWHAARRFTHGALDNARRSLDDISRAIVDRQLLRPDVEEPQHAGDLGFLTTDACWERLRGRSVGRLAYVARAGLPDIVPVNYSIDEGTILIRSGAGPKLQAAERKEMAAFEVDDLDEAAKGGWSVVVIGRLEVVRNASVGVGAGPEPWATGPRRHLVRLTPTRTTGRTLMGEQ
jgi:hypothetical protein